MDQAVQETPSDQRQTYDIQSGDVRLSAYHWPNPGKPKLLFVHGYPDNASVWDGTIDALKGDYEIIAYDVRGAGRSDRPKRTSAYKMAQLTDDMITVIDAISPDEPVHLIAHDWGSIQSWNAIMDDRIKQRVKSYTSLSGVSIDHLGQWIGRRFKQGQWGKAFGQLLKSWYIYMFHLPFFDRIMWTRWFSKRWHIGLGRSEGARIPENPTQLEDGRFGVKLYRANVFPHLLRPNPGPIETPVQMLILTKDPFVSPAIFSDHAEICPQLWRHEIATPHWLPFRDPKLLAAKVSTFVQHLEGAPESASLKRARLRAQTGKGVSEGAFAGKQALITGAGGGIGRSTALALAAEGADILISDIDQSAAETTATMVRDLGRNADIFPCDVSKAEDWDALAGWVDEVAGPVDIMVNNAGIGMSGELMQMDRAAWDRVMGINLGGVVEGSRLFGERMIRNRSGGHIVNVCSAAGFTPSRMFPGYATSKAAALMLTECLRAEMAEHDVGVTAVCPGFVDTGIAMATEYVGSSDEDQRASRENADTMYKRRAYTPDQVAAIIIKAIKKNKPMALAGAEAIVMRGIQRFTPSLGRAAAKLNLNK